MIDPQGGSSSVGSPSTTLHALGQSYHMASPGVNESTDRRKAPSALALQAPWSKESGPKGPGCPQPRVQGSRYKAQMGHVPLASFGLTPVIRPEGRH